MDKCSPDRTSAETVSWIRCMPSDPATTKTLNFSGFNPTASLPFQSILVGKTLDERTNQCCVCWRLGKRQQSVLPEYRQTPDWEFAQGQYSHK